MLLNERYLLSSSSFLKDLRLVLWITYLCFISGVAETKEEEDKRKKIIHKLLCIENKPTGC